MSTELIIILELVAVLVIILLISVVVWRDKSSEIAELREVNQALIVQLEQMQSILDAKKDNQESVNEKFRDLEDELDEQINDNLGESDISLGNMERILNEQKETLTGLDNLLKQPEPDVEASKLEIIKLLKQLSNNEDLLASNRLDLKNSAEKVKGLKQKMRDLSKEIISLNTLEASENRLKRDKTRLAGRIDEIKEKYENQKIIARNLKNELKTSFKASEVEAMKNDLKNTEEQLRRTIIEKTFIEQHYLELANNDDPEELNRELKRVHREIKQLEKSILDSE
jgi:chromosome segregation ATPase